MIKKLSHFIRELHFFDTLKHGSIYTLGTIGVQVLSVISLPIFTKFLSPADFGIFETFNNTVRFLSILFSVNLQSGLGRYFYDENVNKFNLIKTLFITSLMTTAGFSLVLIIFNTQFMNFINLPFALFWFMIPSVFLLVIQNYFTTICNVSNLSTRSTIWTLVLQASKIVFSILFVYFLFRNYKGRVYGEFIVTVVITLMILLLYFREFIGFPRWKKLDAEVYKYSYSFIPIALSGFILTYVDSIIINIYKGNEQTGIYAFAYKIAIIYSSLTVGYITANKPKMFDLMNQKQTDEVQKNFTSLFKIVMAASCFFILFAENIGSLLSQQDAFDKSLYLLPKLIMAYVLLDFNEMCNFYIYYSKKIKYFYISVIAGCVLNIVFNILFVPVYGYVASAYLTLLTHLFIFLLNYYICKNILKAPIMKFRIVLKNITILCVITAVYYLLYAFNINVYLIFLVKILIFSAFLLYLWQNLVRKFNSNVNS